MTPKTHPTADRFFAKPSPWQQEYLALRKLALASGLTEDFKWGWPCYTLAGKNVALIHGFKHYCALLFHKGALIKDPKKILIQQTEHVQAARQARFTSLADLTKQTPALKACLKQAVALEKAGAKVPMKATAEFKAPAEFTDKLKAMPKLKAAFEALTPGRQRAYLLFFSQAKQAETRVARVEKCVKGILEGKGLGE